MRKTLTYSSFIIASLLVFAAFVTATSYVQLGIAVLLYPLLAIFAFKVLPRKAWKAPVITIGLPLPARKAEKVAAEEAIEEVRATRENITVADIDKRAFLKLIGAAGVSLFLYSIFIKRAESAFFGRSTSPETVSIKDTTDRKIDPAERQPTDGYRISEIDDNLITFYGFTNKDGAWFIMREDTDTGSFRYTKGDFNFSSGWGNRERLTYGYFNDIF